MGVDCSMILRDDSLRNMNAHEDRLARILAIQDYLVKKYGIANRKEAIPWTEDDGGRFPRFNFEPYGICSINMYDGFWEIETAWRFSQYFDENGGPSGLQSEFFDIAQDFGCDEAYICSEFCAWNGGELEMRSFDEWLEEMHSRFGEIREIDASTKYHHDTKVFPDVFHESFTECKGKMEELSRRVAAKGYSANGIHTIGWHFITVMKNDRVFVMNRDSLELLLTTPVDFWLDLNRSSFEVVSAGKTYLFACNGEILFETDKGHFGWEWAPHDEWNDFHAIRVFNRDSGQEVIVVNEALPIDNPNELYLFKTYYDRNHNVVIPRIRA